MVAGKKMKMGTVTFDCIETGQKTTISLALAGDKLSFTPTFDPPLDKEKPVQISPVNHLFVMLMEVIHKRGEQNG